jgi:hypothetical protein
MQDKETSFASARSLPAEYLREHDQYQKPSNGRNGKFRRGKHLRGHYENQKLVSRSGKS